MESHFATLITPEEEIASIEDEEPLIMLSFFSFQIGHKIANGMHFTTANCNYEMSLIS